MSLRFIAAAVWIVLALVPLRAEPVDVGFEAARIDLLPVAEVVKTDVQAATAELPAAGARPRQTVTLNGRGPGPSYRWAVFSLHNPGAQGRDLVISAPHQRFVDSQVWPVPEGSRIVGVTTADGRPVQPLASIGADAFALTVPPGAVTTFALEVSPTGLDSLWLWHRGAFHAVADRFAFFRGLVLGISILLGIGFICLFIVRPRAVFPAAALFGWSAIAFLVIETGYLPAVLAKFPTLSGAGQGVRAVTEGLMLAGVLAMLASFVELRRWMPLVGMALMAGVGAALALVFYGWFEPRLAIGVIRIAFAAAVAAGLIVIMVLWRRGAVRAQASLLGWVVLTGWTVAAGIGALGLVDPAVMHPLVSAGLVLVLVTIGFTLAQIGFGLGLASSEAFEEAGRRALALAASDQAVWDWQVDESRLYVGPEIERALGTEDGACSDSAGWLDVIHPSDRVAYGAAVEAAERRGRGSFSQEFRLRRADGSYRWYELRARAIPGGNHGASRLIGTLADVTGPRRSEDRLLADAVRDRLTGLPNRALFLDRLEQAMHRGRGVADPDLYVIALDLDRFKSFNDGLGSEAGDYLLTTVGRRLQACIGPADTLARLPGHQFGIIWHANPLAAGIAELTQAMGASVAEPIHLPAGEVILTASMGVALVQREYRRADAVLRDAEIALHEAKRQGYGAVEFFRPDMHDEGSALVQLEHNLRRALARNEIEVVYQPIIRLEGRELAGFEALMRWRRDGHVLEPDSFMGLAEETGIIRELGRYVLQEATSRLGTWQRTFRSHEPLFVAVNISSVQLLNADLVEDVQRFIAREDLQPGTLKLELTESLVVENPELAHKLLLRLKQLGVALACDDFGTGYSGLESVFRLPFDSVKIDRLFLEGDSGDRNWIMVEAMLRLARDLGLEVVAEGIETEGQMEELSRLGCDYGQGYFIGPPVSAQKVVTALGGHAYGARGPGAGLAAFWTRLTGPNVTGPNVRGPDITGPSGPAARARDARQQPERAKSPPAGPPVGPSADPHGGAWAEDSAAAPGATANGDAEPVIDVRSIMPGSGKAPSPAVPEVGSAPFAPRHVRPPEASTPVARRLEPGPAEAGPPVVEPPQPEPPQPEPAEPEPAEPEPAEPEPAEPKPAEEPSQAESAPEPATAAAAEEPAAVPGPETEEVPAAAPDSPAGPAPHGAAKRQKRQKRKAKGGAATNRPADNGTASKGAARKATARRSAAKTGAAKKNGAADNARAKTGATKAGTAKSASAGTSTSTGPAETGQRASPAKRSPTKRSPTKRSPAKRSPAKRSPASDSPAKQR